MTVATTKTAATAKIECAFCGGTGKDPFGVMSRQSGCPVCNGHREVYVQKPTVPCAYCRATGKQPHTRLSCPTCRGKGVFHLAGPTIECPQCDGSGKEPGDTNLPCWLCRGAGLLNKSAFVPKEITDAAADRKAAAKRRAAKRAAAAKDHVAGSSATIACAFCDGTGVDPFGAMSEQSNCPVCNGHAKVHVREPTVTCMFCHATGNQPGTRLTCSACRGKGALHLPGPTTQCSNCDGIGKEPKTNMHCAVCKGAGLVAKDSTVGQRIMTPKPKTARRKPGRTTTAPEEMMVVECAFCGGMGKDPYHVLSSLSNCPVCHGRTKMSVRKPAYSCAYCHGTGKQRHTRLTCSACRGIGHVTVAGPTTECPECEGSGKARGADLPCVLCQGAGLIAEKAPAPAEATSGASKGGAGGETR